MNLAGGNQTEIPGQYAYGMQTQLNGQAIPVPWGNEAYNGVHVPIRYSQYYNVFPNEAPATNTSWTFPNGCVTSSIVRFTGGAPTPTIAPPPPSIPNIQIQNNRSGALPIKRKSFTPDVEIPPNKMFISEEKMAARMNEMHISNDYVAHNALVPLKDDDDMNDDLLLPANSDRQFVMCDELKDMNRNIESIPGPLIPYAGTTTAVVLWKPPVVNVIKKNPTPQTHSSVIITEITDDDVENNNDNEMSEIPTIQNADVDFETMEL